MKKPVVFAVLALIFYAFQNVILEQKLSKYSTFAMLTYFYLAVFPLALAGLGYMKITKQPIIAPSGRMIVLVYVVGLIYFFADSLYIGAYTHGGSALVVSTIVVLFPVMVSVVRHFWVGGWPNYYQIAGYILATLAVFLVVKGNLANSGQ